MNRLTALFLFLIPACSYAAGIELTCVTEFPTTSFIVKQAEDGYVYARMIQHNGTKYMPIFSGIIVPNDLPMLAEKAERLQKLATDMTFRWPAKNCVKHDDFRFECFGTDDSKEVNGTRIAPFALYTGRVKHDNIAGRYEELRVGMDFSVGERSQTDDVEMSYPSGFCVPEALGALGALELPKKR